MVDIIKKGLLTPTEKVIIKQSEAYAALKKIYDQSTDADAVRWAMTAIDDINGTGMFDTWEQEKRERYQRLMSM